MKRPTRYFTYCIDDETNEIDIVETSQRIYDQLIGTVYREIHTIFNNGVNQLCWTVYPLDYPLMSEVQLKEGN